MAIIRTNPSQNFTIVSNGIFESNLSFEAVGLLTYLLSKPPHWSVSVAQLVNRGKKGGHRIGKEKIYKLLNELIDAGYVVRLQTAGAGGKFNSVDYFVHDSPQESESRVESESQPLTDLPDAAAPDAAKPTLVRNEKKKEMNSINKNHPLYAALTKGMINSQPTRQERRKLISNAVMDVSNTDW